VTLSGARFGLAAILARRLSQAGYGQFAYAQWLVDLAFLICSLGVNAAATRFIAEYRSRPAALAAITKYWWPFALGIPLLAGCFVLLGAFLFEVHLSPTAMMCLSLWAFSSGVWAMQTAALSGLQRFDLIFFANVIAAFMLLVGTSLVRVIDGDMSTIFLVMAAASCMASLVGISATLRLASVTPAPLNAASWRSIRTYSANMWATSLLASLVWSRGELPIVRAELGDAGVAQYAAALTIFGGVMQGTMLAVSAVAPKLTRLWGEGARTKRFRFPEGLWMRSYCLAES